MDSTEAQIAIISNMIDEIVEETGLSRSDILEALS